MTDGSSENATSAGNARDRMIDSAVILLAQHGYQATSFHSVLAVSGAPRGSIYHHFPRGKDELIAAAIELTGDQAMRLLDSLHGLSAAEVLDGFVEMWRAVLTRSDFSAGCSVLAVTVSADAQLVQRAADVFRRWRERLTTLLRDGGVEDADARDLASTIIAATEGAVVLSRAERSTEPLDAVHRQLARLLP